MNRCPHCGAVPPVKNEWIKAYELLYITGMHPTEAAAYMGIKVRQIYRYIDNIRKARPGLIELFDEKIPELDKMIHGEDQMDRDKFYRSDDHSKHDPIMHKF